MAFHGEPEQAT